MENEKKYYKEQIKDRMIKNAASFWGVRNADNFDKVVKVNNSVEVEKGIQVSAKPKEGLIRTIDIFIDSKKQCSAVSSEDLKDRLYSALIGKSPDTYNYRIFINK